MNERLRRSAGALALAAGLAAPAAGQQIVGPEAVPEHTLAGYRLEVPREEGEHVRAFWSAPEAVSRLVPDAEGLQIYLTAPPGRYTLRVEALVGATFETTRRVAASRSVTVAPSTAGRPSPPPPGTTIAQAVLEAIAAVPARDRPAVVDALRAGVPQARQRARTPDDAQRVIASHAWFQLLGAGLDYAGAVGAASRALLAGPAATPVPERLDAFEAALEEAAASPLMTTRTGGAR